MREAKERKRLERVCGEPLRVDVRGVLVWTITLHNRQTGKMCSLDLRVSKRRLNSFDVSVDGKSWKRTMNASRIATSIRKKIVPHWMVMD